MKRTAEQAVYVRRSQGKWLPELRRPAAIERVSSQRLHVRVGAELVTFHRTSGRGFGAWHEWRLCWEAWSAYFAEVPETAGRRMGKP